MGGANDKRFIPCSLVRRLSEIPWILEFLHQVKDAGLFQGWDDVG